MTDKKQLHLAIFGGQGAGKGTQAAALARHYGLLHLSTGELTREMSGEDTERGHKAREILAQGELLPDAIIDRAVAEKIRQLPPAVGFVLDGYPRTLAQAKTLQGTLASLQRLQPQPVFINLEVPRQELVTRLLKRGRTDDTAELIARRLDIYEEQTQPIIEAVKEWARVLKIDGSRSIEEVTKQITEQLDE